MKKKLLVTLSGVLSIIMLAGCGNASSETAYATNGMKDASYNQLAGAAADGFFNSYDSYDYYDDYAAYDDYAYMETEATAEEYDWDNGMSDSSMYKDPSQPTDTADALSNRKLITTVDMNVETDAFDDLVALIESRTAALGGYIEHVSVDNRYDGSRHGNYIIRVPEKRLDEFTNAVSTESNVTNRERSVEDVTLAYVDMQSRKEVLRTEEKRLLEMLENAEDVETMIMVESRLSDVQSDIESMESQLRVFDNQISFSTIYLNVNEVKVFTVIEEETAWTRMVNGFKNSLVGLGRGLTNFGIGLVSSLPYLVFIAIIIFAIVMIIRAIVKSAKKKSAKKKEAMQYAYYQQQMAYNAAVQNQQVAQGNVQAAKQSQQVAQGNAQATMQNQQITQENAQENAQVAKQNQQTQNNEKAEAKQEIKDDKKEDKKENKKETK